MFTAICLTFISCETNQANESVSPEYSLKPGPVTFKLVFITWDEWGRASKDCNGWGLCNYTWCTFCCLDEFENITPCPKSNESLENRNTGTVEIDPDSHEGFLYIKLDNSKPEQNDAILNEKEFFIDQNISIDGITLHQGIYQYDSSIGSRGGYKINASEY